MLISLFRTEKCGKQSLSSVEDLKNSTTGCEDLTELARTVRKSMKSDPFMTLSAHSGQLLMISMGKSSPFEKEPENRFWDSVDKQSI